MNVNSMLITGGARLMRCHAALAVTLILAWVNESGS